MSGENGTAGEITTPLDDYKTIRAALGAISERYGEIDFGMPGHRPKEVLDSFEAIVQGARMILRGLDPNVDTDWQEKLGGESVDAVDLAKYIDMEFPWLMEPLLCRGFLTQIQGAPKGGKSAFSLWLSLLAATGDWNRLKVFDATPATPRKVLYIAWEDPKIMMAKRLSKFAVGLGYERTFLPQNLRFLFGPTFFANRADHVAALSEAIKEYGADILVIDTLSHSHECKENVAEEMRIPMNNLNQMCQALNIAVLYIHHTSKGSGMKADVDKARGSTAIAAAWHILIDWGQREKDSDVNPVEIQSKLDVNGSWQVNYGKQFDHPTDPKKLTGVVWSIEDGKQGVDLSGITKGAGKKEKPGIARVHECLLSLAPQHPGDIPGKNIVGCMADQGMSKTAVYRHLGELIEQGVVGQRTAGKATLYKLTGI